VLLSPFASIGEIYKYRDAKGQVHYTDNIGNVPEDQRPHVSENNKIKRDNIQNNNTHNTTSNKSISDEQLKVMMKKAIEDKYEIEVKDSCPKETEDEIIQDIKSTWGALSKKMIAGDIEAALTYFTAYYRDSYRRTLSDLGDKELKDIFKSFEKNEIEIGSLYKDDGEASCIITRLEKEGTYSYPVRFVKDLDCIWRISEM